VSEPRFQGVCASKPLFSFPAVSSTDVSSTSRTARLTLRSPRIPPLWRSDQARSNVRPPPVRVETDDANFLLQTARSWSSQNARSRLLERVHPHPPPSAPRPSKLEASAESVSGPAARALSLVRGLRTRCRSARRCRPSRPFFDLRCQSLLSPGFACVSTREIHKLPPSVTELCRADLPAFFGPPVT
jgi:hypothetical protein